MTAKRKNRTTKKPINLSPPKNRKVIKASTKIPRKDIEEVAKKLRESSVPIPNPEKVTVFTGLDDVKYEITIKQRLFCEYYLQFYGNGTQAIVSAGYSVHFRGKGGEDTGGINYKLASVMAAENLVKPSICAYINLKLKKYGFDDDNVDKQHLFLINQYDDLAAKAKGIDMFYKVKNKYPKEKSDVNVNIATPILGGITHMPLEERKKMLDGVHTDNSN